MDGNENDQNGGTAAAEDEWTDIQLQPSGELGAAPEQAPAPAKRRMLKKKLGVPGKAKSKGAPGTLYIKCVLTQHCHMRGIKAMGNVIHCQPQTSWLHRHRKGAGGLLGWADVIEAVGC